MAHIAHPETGDRIEVNVLDSESYRGTDVMQVEATDEHIDLSDRSGEQPWVEADEVSDDS